MTKKEIKEIWRKLLIPFFIGALVLIFSLVLNKFGSKRAIPQMFSLFGTVLGTVFIVFPVIKMIKFKKYLNSL